MGLFVFSPLHEVCFSLSAGDRHGFVFVVGLVELGDRQNASAIYALLRPFRCPDRVLIPLTLARGLYGPLVRSLMRPRCRLPRGIRPFLKPRSPP